MSKHKLTLKELDKRITDAEATIHSSISIHWTKKLGVTYDTPVDTEPKQCPKCGSKNLGRTPEVISLFRSPLMCRDCRHTFGGNLPPFQPLLYSTVWQPEAH